MISAAAAQGGSTAVPLRFEPLISIRRAGADIVLTY